MTGQQNYTPGEIIEYTSFDSSGYSRAEVIRGADVMTSDTSLWVFRQPLPEDLARLRVAMAAAGVTAESPDMLNAEAERMACEDRKD